MKPYTPLHRADTTQFVKFGLTTEAFESYVPLIVDETNTFLRNSRWMQGDSGVLDVPPAMAELTIYTASRTLQGEEVRGLSLIHI